MGSFIKFAFCVFLIFYVNNIFSKEIDINITNETLNSDKSEYIGKRVYIYQDIYKTQSINTIRKSKNLFHLNNTDVINFGLSEYYNWIHFTIANNSDNENLILNLEYPIIDNATLYLIDKNNKIDSIDLFESFSKTKRLYNSPFYLFPIKLNKNEHIESYLRLFSYKPILVPLSIDNVESTVTKINNIDILSGVYIGIMFVMLLYNLFVYFTTKDNSYFYYVLYIAGVTITQLTILGYSNKYFWSSNLWLSQIAVPLTGAISGLVTLLFTDKFLHTKKHLFKFHVLLRLLMLIDIICIVVLMLGYKILGYHIVDANAGVGAIVIFLTAILLVIRGYRPAKFFLIGWIIFIIAIILYVVKDYGILPYNNLTIHSLQFGSALEAILLSFALADKINIYKKEKEQSQAQTLSALQENERIIKEQNVTLERNVKERTFELVTTNNNLNKTLTELKEAQSQLVEAEKMASLGQLTAGIAHEINNPINFVTSNVAPLRRDVDLLINVINNTESLALSDISADEKQQQIEDYKEEIEFDFLKIEIDQLINGIHEGATRTADIVKGLKIFSRLDENDLKKADINECLQSTLTIANNLIGDKIQVIKNFADIPLIECYPGKLNQVFLNIISNAVFAIQEKFKNQAGGCLKVTTDFNTDTLFIRIEDNGTGMSEAVKKKIYEPFFTTKEVGVGTGLGMSIVYNTIKKHNGHINLDSAEGLGTTFTIELQLIFKELVTDYQSEQN